MKTMKRAALLLLLMALGLLSGCVSQVTERAMENIEDMTVAPGADVPEEDGVQARTQRVTLYFLSEDGERLFPVVREIEVGEEGIVRAALNALLGGPLETETGASWPDLGTARSERLLEVSSGVATVDLPARARSLSQNMLYAMRLAITNTLTELQAVSYVNVLIGGREEGFDLGGTLPVGTLTRVEDMDVASLYSRLQDQRQSGQSATMLTTLYMPTADGALLLPVVRSVTYDALTPIDCLYELLTELGKGSGNALMAQSIPAPMQYIEEMPEIARTEDGAYRAIDIRFSAALSDALYEAGLTRGIYLAMLTDTLMGFVPGVEGVRVFIGGEQVTELTAVQTPDGQARTFAQTLMTRADFAGFMGAPCTLYVSDGDGGLRSVQAVLPQEDQNDLRERLTELLRLPETAGGLGLPQTELLAIYEGEEAVAVNLSGAFGNALAALDAEQVRVAVYAMVNTLTEGKAAQKVVFFFDGEQMGTLADGIDMRGAFVRNPGMEMK